MNKYLPEEVDASLEHGAGVGEVGAGQRGAGVPGAGLEDGVVRPEVLARGKAGASDQPTHQVAHNRPIEVGRDHHVKLPWVAHQLHAAVKAVKNYAREDGKDGV